MASSRRRPSIRIILVLFIRIIRSIGTVGWVVVGGGGGGGRVGVEGGICVGCVGRIVDAIVDGTEDCGGVRLAVVDCTVWVGFWRRGVDAEVRRARAERALSEVARKVGTGGRAGGGSTSTGILLVKIVVVVAGPAVALVHRDSTDDNSKATNDANDAERSTDSSFVLEKALRGGPGGGSGENGRSGVGGEGVAVAGHR